MPITLNRARLRRHQRALELQHRLYLTGERSGVPINELQPALAVQDAISGAAITISQFEDPERLLLHLDGHTFAYQLHTTWETGWPQVTAWSYTIYTDGDAERRFGGGVLAGSGIETMLHTITEWVVSSTEHATDRTVA